MEDYPYPIIVEGDWRTEHAKSVKNKLQIYFQSKKKSNGGDCAVQYDEKSGTATVQFKSSDTRDGVLSKADHMITIEKCEVKLKVSKPGDVEEQPDNTGQPKEQACGYQKPNQSAPQTELDVKDPQESSAVVLENVPDDAKKYILALLVENVSNLSENDFRMELIPELNKTVVIFNNHSAAGKFLEKSRTHRNFQQYNLRARALERSTCVRVEDLPAEANEMLLELYFQKWGGPVEDIITVPSEKAAIMTFKKEEAKDKVLKMEHTICSVPVKIYPYFKSLGTALYGSNRPTWKLPDPITVSVHPAIRKFLLKKGLISSIRDQMSSHFSQINMDKPDVLLSPDPALLKQKGVTRRHIDGWSKNASDAFNELMSNYTAFEWPVLNTLWTKLEGEIKEVVTDMVFIDMDSSKGIVSLAGVANDVIGLKPIMKKMLERATTQMERERKSVTEDMDMSPTMYFLLVHDGMQGASTVSPQLHIDYKKDLNKLVLSGLKTEILTFKNDILEKKLKIKQKHLRMDRSILEFLRSVDCDEMSRDLFISHGISAVYTVFNGDILLFGSTERALADAEKKLGMVLTFSILTVKDQGVLALPQWQDLNKTLQNSYNTSKKRTVLINFSAQRDKVIVSGFREPVREVSLNLGDFIENRSRIEDVVRVKSHAVVEFIKDKKSQDWKSLFKSDEVKVNFDSKRPWIKLSGERAFVQPAMTFFIKMADALYTDTLIIKKAGAKKYFMEQGRFMLSMFLKEKGFVVVLQEDHMIEDEEDEFYEGSSEDFGQLSCEVRMPGGVTVTVRKADICKLNVDAVVNAANEDLQHTGGVALALLKAAGPHLQQCCDRYTKVNGRLRAGDAVITEAGQLPCKYVVHAVGPRFSNSDRPTAVKCLRHAVRESLNMASGKNCSSIAVPTISSGIFGCPLELCTETIAKEVHDYIDDQNRSGSRSSLTEINLVDNNDSTVKAMAHAVRKEFAAFSPKMTFPHHPSSKPHWKSNHGHRGQAYRGRGRGRGRGDHGHRNQDFRSHNYEPKNEHGNRDFERQTHGRGETTGSFSPARSENFEGVFETKTTQEGLKITLRKGNIQDACADIIVNTISEDLDLRKGAVSRSILQTAGHQLQSEVTRAARLDNPHYGDTVITNGYNLKCTKVFHVICPFWNGGHRSEDEVLIQIIRDCLGKSDAQGMASISLPAIGTGNLGFPKDLVAKIMLSEFQQFTPQNLREVTVIVHPSDKESAECFTNIFRHGIQGPITKGGNQLNLPKANSFVKTAQTSEMLGKVSTPSLGVHTLHVGQVILEVSSGDITKEKTDAIVNSSNHTFSLKAGVSKAILGAAGLQVEQECLQIVSSSNSQQKEIVTSAGQLPCGNIIHIIGRNSPADIKNGVLSVLKLCEAHKFTSVAFPALGTGQGGANPADVADAMVDAFVDFVKKKKAVHVKFVKFLIFQMNMVADFHQSMLRRSGEKVEEEKSMLGKIKDFFLGYSSENPTNEEFVIVSKEIEPVVFQLCGETAEDLRNAREMINTLIIKEQMNIPICDPAIAHFTKEDVEMLNAMQRELTVSFKLEKKGQHSVITLEGLTRDVHIAESRIWDMIRKVERNEKRRRDAFMLSSVVEWKYMDGGHSLKSFDMLTNFDLEMAYQNKQPSVKIKIDNDEFYVDIFQQVAIGQRTKFKLKRVDLEVAQTTLPSHWDDMKGQSVVVVQLAARSQEYADVEKAFKRTGLTFNIITIERVQNSTLWKNYMIKKEELEDKNQHKNNEKHLFHSTDPDKTDQINHHGFNRSYAGMHGAMYGKGSYFAVDPSYSAQGYPKPDAKGHRCMYLARVLVGDFTQGKQGLVIPPAKSSNGVDLYNSVTDNQNNPSMFVIFNDVQAYPEFLITFQ